MTPPVDPRDYWIAGGPPPLADIVARDAAFVEPFAVSDANRPLAERDRRALLGLLRAEMAVYRQLEIEFRLNAHLNPNLMDMWRGTVHSRIIKLRALAEP